MLIRNRLRLILLVVLILAVVSGVSALWAMSRLQTAIDQGNASLKSQRMALEMRSRVLSTSDEVDALFKGVEGANQRFEASIKGCRGALLDLDGGSASSPSADDDRRAAERLGRALTNFERAVRRSLRYTEEGQDDKGLERFRRYVTDRFAPEVTHTVDLLVELHNQRVTDGQNRASLARRRVNVLVSVSSLLVLIVGIASISLVEKWLLVPVERLVLAARGISRGEYRRKIPVEGDDELGQLAREVESMSSSIADFQKQLVEKERMAAVGEMTASVAHNIRNPLASIRALAQTCQRDPETPEESVPTMKTIVETVDRADRWLRDLLVALRPVRVEATLTEINDRVTAVASACELSASRRGVEITLDLDERVGSIPVDPRRIDQALLVLVQNAIDASSEGSKVAISTEAVDESEEVLLKISDEGEGMTEEVQKKLFTPYFTTKKSGIGLGLSLTQRIIFGHGGTIDVDSAAGHGCLMTVRLPRRSPGRKGQDGTDSNPRR